ncbi:MAG: gamma-glutamyltransferase [Betaproteobacteria bacterium]|nr:gamma-glutamyltransferase [Betaproteobacteria bacterium]
MRGSAVCVALLLCVLVAFPAQARTPAGPPEAATGRTEKQAVVARRFMIVTANPLATRAGVEVLRAGGGAVDAAIAVQMVLGLVEPQSSGIGGGAFLLHWSRAERRVRSYDGRESAPRAARPDRFLDASRKPLAHDEAVAGGLSVGVPGALRMLQRAHRRHGRLPWAMLFRPAIRLAESGFAMSPRLHRLLDRESALRNDPLARRLYYTDDDRARPVGERIVNTAYAATLRAIARFGAGAFYSGPIAQDIVRAVRAHPRPGDLALDDLAGYAALERAPVCGPYRGYRICSMGPPSAGGVAVLQVLGILERTAFGRAAPNSAEAVHYFSEASRLAFADRARYIADPAFVPQPVAGLLEPAYLDARARLIGERSMGQAPAGAPRRAPAALGEAAETEHVGTSHVSIVDGRGDAVAMTTTIEDAFGSRIMVRGFLLNNQLTDFSFVPERDGRPVANRVEPGKRPRSSMAPTLVFDAAGNLRLVAGSPGGPAIIDYVAKALVAALDWKLDAQAASSLPNFGSRNGPTEIERGTVYELLAPELRERGHDVHAIDLASGLHLIERIPGGWRGGADPRREGLASGR